MANFGISVVNNSHSVMITSEYKVMVFSERGIFGIQSRYTDREGGGHVTFIKPIFTREPPQIFLRHVSGLHPNLGVYTTILGGPGNWSGFNVTSAVQFGSLKQNYIIEYVSCKYADKPSAQPYGMNIWDSTGAVVFAASDRIVRYSKFSKVWTLVRGSQVDIYDSSLIIDSDDFIAVSSLDRGVVWFADGANYVGLNLLDKGLPSLKITAQQTSGGYSYYQGANLQNFCIPVCKFPAGRYCN